MLRLLEPLLDRAFDHVDDLFLARVAVEVVALAREKRRLDRHDPCEAVPRAADLGEHAPVVVDAIRIAHDLDLLTAPYVFNDDDAAAMAAAGADVLVPHMGLTTGGSIGADTAKTLDDCVPLIQGMHDAAKRVNADVIVLCHGGPIAEPDDAAYILERTEGVVGFFGASSMERLPTEVAMTENMKRFKSIPVKGV